MNNRGKQAIGQSAHPGEEDFYRKGIVGDWKNHFDPEMLNDIGRIEQRGLSAGMDVVKNKGSAKGNPAKDPAAELIISWLNLSVKT